MPFSLYSCSDPKPVERGPVVGRPKRDRRKNRSSRASRKANRR